MGNSTRAVTPTCKAPKMDVLKSGPVSNNSLTADSKWCKASTLMHDSTRCRTVLCETFSTSSKTVEIKSVARSPLSFSLQALRHSCSNTQRRKKQSDTAHNAPPHEDHDPRGKQLSTPSIGNRGRTRHCNHEHISGTQRHVTTHHNTAQLTSTCSTTQLNNPGHRRRATRKVRHFVNRTNVCVCSMVSKKRIKNFEKNDCPLW